MAGRNRLADASSPYLLQHAHNPVDWYPWGPEALERARREDRPILLSIGYAACHWCHVMAHESFENDEIAAAMNADFVCIKVDREERPDLDDIYMAATIAMTGSGGWPMTVFLTPDQTPFFAGTYFPPDDSNGRMGFPSLLRRVAQLWAVDRDSLFRQAGELTEHIVRQSDLPLPRDIPAQCIERAIEHLERTFDEERGGFGSAPKFPPCSALMLLMLRASTHPGNRLLVMIRRTLDAMKAGGLYDQLGGGFARYSTDDAWLVPHFEKMLYDNAQLARVYLAAFQLTADPEYRRIATETLDYVIREMQEPAGGYYSSCDADSEGIEGKFFVWTPTEVSAMLSKEQAALFCAYFDVTDSGNWEGGGSILHTPRPLSEVAAELSMAPQRAESLLKEARSSMLAARNLRVAPSVDDKVLTSWNGLMIGAMAEGYRVLGEERFLSSAVGAAEYVLRKLVREGTSDGGIALWRTARGARAHLDGYLEDYAFLASGLLDLYEASADGRFLTVAERLMTRVMEEFRDDEGGAFFQSARGAEELISRVRDGQDGALPNANAVAAHTLGRLGLQLDRDEFVDAGRQALRAYGQRIEHMPRAFATALTAADFFLQSPIELVFSRGAEALQREVARYHLPHRIIAHATEGAPETPLLRGKGSVGSPRLYVCHHHHCEAPITQVSQVGSALRAAVATRRVAGQTRLAAARARGLATIEGTRRYFSNRRLTQGVHLLGDTGLSVGRLGFGGYRVYPEDPEHQQALSLALQEGCNLIDTAGNYAGGGSERVVAAALAELFRQGKLKRDEVVVVSKVGMGRPTGATDRVSGWVQLSAELGYSLHPDWLEQQLQGSLDRLNLEQLDYLLVHNPESLLIKLDREQVRERLTDAFRWLESQVVAGRIGGFGVSSNSLGQSEGFQVEELVGVAAAASAVHFKILECPLNPLELGIANEPGAGGRPGVGGGSGNGGQTLDQISLLERAWRAGLAVIVNRPLNALRGDTLVRLADAPEELGAPDLESCRQEVAKLEHEFRSRLGAVLMAVPEIDLPIGEFFSWADKVGDQEVSSRELWNEFERDILAPRLPHLIGALNRAFRGKQLDSVWREWRDRYVHRLEQWVIAARAVASANTNARNRGFAEVLRQGIPEQRRGASLSRLVLWHVSSLEAVSCVLVGMRSVSHVHDATATLAWPELESPLERMRRAAAALHLS